MVIPPVQLPVSNLKKLGFFWVGAGAGAAGTTNPSRSIVSNLFKQSSASKMSVIHLSVVGVKMGVLAFTEALSLFSTMSNPKLLVSSLFWTIFASRCVSTNNLMKLCMSHKNDVWLDGLFKSNFSTCVRTRPLLGKECRP